MNTTMRNDDSDLDDAIRRSLADIIASGQAGLNASEPAAISTDRHSHGRWFASAAAVVLLVAGLGLISARRGDSRAPADQTSSTRPASSLPGPAIGLGEPKATAATDTSNLAETPSTGNVLLLPSADVEMVYVQHDPAVPHRVRGLVSAADGSTFSINLYENYWGELPTDTEQREINGSTWANARGDSRTYVTLDQCTMLTLDAGPNASPWNDNALALIGGTKFADPVTVDLPEGWNVIAVGSVGDWYSMTFDPEIAGIPRVTLTQTPGTSAGPLLADLAGRPIENVIINGNPGWQIPLPEPGWYQTIWQNDNGAMMLLSNGLTPDAIGQLVAQLTPASGADWDNRYSNQDVGPDGTIADPNCAPAAITIR